MVATAAAAAARQLPGLDTAVSGASAGHQRWKHPPAASALRSSRKAHRLGHLLHATCFRLQVPSFTVAPMSAPGRCPECLQLFPLQLRW
jgi:hypothetical protein